MKKVFLVSLMLVLVIGMVFSACAKPAATPTPKTSAPTGTSTPATAPKASPTPIAPPAGTPEYGGVLKMITFTIPPTPIGRAAQTRAATATQVAGNLQQLFVVKPNGFEPRLATKWVTDPGKSVTFELRKGVKFHDGTTWNAEAAKWGLEQLKKENRNGTGSWTSVSIVDDYTVRLNVSAYDISMLTLLAEYHFESPSYRAKVGDAVADWSPVGTGPFRFKSYKEAVALEYERFDGYWGTRPYLDGFSWIYVADASTQILAVQKGVAHLVFDITVKQANDLKALGFQIIAPEIGVILLVPDTVKADSPFNDTRVRQAIDYALNKEQLARVVLSGYGAPAYQTAGKKEYWSYNPALESSYRTYNPAKAKDLLAAAGFPNGFKTQIVARNITDRDQLVSVQDMMKQVGIQVDLPLISTPKYEEMRLVGWSGLMWTTAVLWAGDVLSMWQRHMPDTRPGIGNVSAKRPAEWDELFRKLLLTADPAEATKIAQQMSKVTHDTAWVVPLFSYNVIDSVANGVHGFLRVGSKDSTVGEVWLEKKLQGK